MGFKCGIVGLPNVGKSTLFNALTQAGIAAENYPFCTIDANVGIVAVPDHRLQALAAIVNPQRVLPTHMEFVDIAGLVKGASQGEGLGNQFLANIRETEAIAHVVRCFEHEDIVHVAGRVAPLDDIEVINTELLLADLEMAEKMLQKLKRHAKSGDKRIVASVTLLDKIVAHLSSGNPVRTLAFEDAQRAMLREYNFITAKPMFYIANVNDDGFVNNPLLEVVNKQAEAEGVQAVVAVCAAMEEELVSLDPDAREEFLADMGLAKSGLERIIETGYNLLGLQTFFTAGEKEVRAWTVKKQASAPEGAGRIHSDFEKGFIRAEVIAYQDYIDCGGEQGAKNKGKWRLEGKDYILQEGDVVHFRFNV